MLSNDGISFQQESFYYNFKNRLSNFSLSIKAAFLSLEKTFKTVVHYPQRFTYNKQSFKGYHKKFQSFEEEVSIENKEFNDQKIREKAHTNAMRFLKYCSATIACFKQDPNWITPFNLSLFAPKANSIDAQQISKTMQVKKDCIIDPSTGLKAIILFDQDEVIICFGSVHTGDHEFNQEGQDIANKKAKAFGERQMRGLKLNLIGLKQEIFQQADQLFQIIKEHPELKNKNITLTGQCLGGALASYVALKNGNKAICFNSFPLGAGQQHELSDQMLNEADEYVTHISAATDYVSDNQSKILTLLDSVISFCRLRTPANFGKHFVIPSAYDNEQATHSYIQGSLMKYLGHTIRTTPTELQSAGIKLF